jgi:hypothetical protein
MAMHDIDRIQIGGRETETYEYSGGGGARIFNEQQEWELASELLEVGNEQEFEQFLGDLISKAGSAIGSFVRSDTGKAIGGVLKGAAGKLLPMAGSAIGGYFGGPGGAQIGGKLAQTAGGLFGLGETENEEREFEAAQTFVRLAADTVKNAAAAPPGAPPAAVAQNAIAQAAQVHAPGLVGPAGPMGGPGGPVGSSPFGGHNRSGRWVRRGGKIVLFGA